MIVSPRFRCETVRITGVPDKSPIRVRDRRIAEAKANIAENRVAPVDDVRLATRFIEREALAGRRARIDVQRNQRVTMHGFEKPVAEQVSSAGIWTVI